MVVAVIILLVVIGLLCCLEDTKPMQKFVNWMLKKVMR